jgi:hypothetical protein
VRSVHLFGLLPFLLGCEQLLGIGDCPSRSLTLPINVSPEELQEALDDDGELSLSECKRLCPSREVDKILGCDPAAPTPEDADTGASGQVFCDVEIAGDC